MSTTVSSRLPAPAELAARNPRLGGHLGAVALLAMCSGAVSAAELAALAGVDRSVADGTLHRLAVSGLAWARVLDGVTWYAITPEGSDLAGVR